MTDANHTETPATAAAIAERLAVLLPGDWRIRPHDPAHPPKECVHLAHGDLELCLNVRGDFVRVLGIDAADRGPTDVGILGAAAAVPFRRGPNALAHAVIGAVLPPCRKHAADAAARTHAGQPRGAGVDADRLLAELPGGARRDGPDGGQLVWDLTGRTLRLSLDENGRAETPGALALLAALRVHAPRDAERHGAHG